MHGYGQADEAVHAGLQGADASGSGVMHINEVLKADLGPAAERR